eukprot:13199546-Heterocapsa_arctica.AAC.1
MPPGVCLDPGSMRCIAAFPAKLQESVEDPCHAGVDLCIAETAHPYPRSPGRGFTVPKSLPWHDVRVAVGPVVAVGWRAGSILPADPAVAAAALCLR